MTLYVWDNNEEYSAWRLLFIETEWPSEVVERAMRYTEPGGCIVACGPKGALRWIDRRDMANGGSWVGIDLRPVSLEEAMKLYSLPSSPSPIPHELGWDELPPKLLASYARRMLAIDEEWLTQNRARERPTIDSHVVSRIAAWRSFLAKLGAD